MASSIPVKIHFVWVGSVIPLKQAVAVLDWSVRNPSYVVFLWTNRPHENALELTKLSERVRTVVGGPRPGQLPNGRSRMMYSNKLHGKTQTIFLHPVQELMGAMGSDLSGRAAQEMYHRNFGGASDILRIAILKKEGGIYLDTDSEPGSPLLPGIVARDAILFGVLEGRGFCNAVIAAPQGHRYLSEIQQSMSQEFGRWGQGTLTRQIDQFRKGVDTARLNVRKATAARDKLQAWGATEEAQDRASDRLKEAKGTLKQQMESGTLVLTGPSRIAIWLYQHVARNKVSIDAFAKKAGIQLASLNNLQTAELVKQYQGMYVSEELTKESVLETYGFPKRYVTIHSEASWIK